MKVLLINGSPHQEGNTAIALAEVAKQLAQEGIDLDNLGIEIIAMDGTHNCLQSSVVEDYILNTNSDE